MGGSDINEGEKQNNSALHSACKVGNSEIAKILVENGADVNVINDKGRTPLIIAAFHGWSDTMAVLLSFQSTNLNHSTVTPPPFRCLCYHSNRVFNKHRKQR